MNKHLFIALFLWSGSVWAHASFCELSLLPAEQRPARAREILLADVRAGNVPAFVKRIGENSIPVILMNAQSEAALSAFTANSMGTELMAKAGWPNNHGSFRYGSNIIDAFIAGQRQVGEIHNTGLSWKNLHDTNLFFDKIADVMVEVAYYLSPEEMTVVDFYQRVRRAALYRVIFQMGDTSIYQKFDNVLPTPVYCFQFSKCSNAQNEINELQQKIVALEQQFGPEFKPDPNLKAEFLQVARAQLLAVDSYAADALNETLINSSLAGELLAKMTPGSLAERQRQLYANYLVGHQAAVDFHNLRQALSISDDSTDGDQAHPRVTALLVYLKGDHAQAFREATAQIGANGYNFNMHGAAKLDP